MNAFQPAYLSLYRSGELAKRVEDAYHRLSQCNVCPRECRVNRIKGELGTCRIGERAKISSYGPHLGEENPLRGWRGSGTIFFTRCNLNCRYCQNHDISQTDFGDEVSPAMLARIMLELQAYGCHNINFVSPSHVVPQILVAVLQAVEKGLTIPLVYNTGGYDSLETLKALDGVIDIYMPDMKYADANIAFRYSNVVNYPDINQKAVREMHRQVGDLQINDRGLATRGLLVRHLVLPNGLAGTDKIVNFLAEEISVNTYLNLMDQYRPSYQAYTDPAINRRITAEEYRTALRLAHEAGLFRLD